jgi:hypothetical protein
MEISLEKLTDLVNEVYERGRSGCADLRQQEIEEAFQKFQIRNDEDYKTWTVEKLRTLPRGTIFQHLIRGRCFIAEKADGMKFMQFDKGQALNFNSDQDPWDKPMRLIHLGGGT